METVTVHLPGRQYEIFIGRGLLSRVGEFMTAVGAGRRTAVVSNPTVASLYEGAVLDSLKGAGFSPFLVQIPDGEEYKTLESVSLVYEELLARQLDRGCALAALGGGVVGDLTGFVAATFLRGVRYLQIPTTLLAQVDSSVGGKTAVDHPRGKNLIGAFHQPAAVISDVQVLRSLPEAEFRSGLAEVVKYGVIADPDFFAFLEDSVAALRERDEEILTRVVRRSCEVKASYVERDEREESGLRAQLNFGHTFAHAVETATAFRGYRHGEAVSVGMICAARLSSRLGLCADREADRLAALLSLLSLPVSLQGVSPTALEDFLIYDKKVREGKLRFVLMKEIGRVFLEESVPLAEVRKVLKAACSP